VHRRDLRNAMSHSDFAGDLRAIPTIVIPGREQSERTRNLEIPGSRFRALRND
jgi:hypothetical protein